MAVLHGQHAARHENIERVLSDFKKLSLECDIVFLSEVETKQST